jgi:hypothetical protein
MLLGGFLHRALDDRRLDDRSVVIAAACSAFDPDRVRELLIFLVTGLVNNP